MGKRGANDAYRRRQLDRAVRGVNNQGTQIDDIHYCLNLVMRHLGMGTVEIVTACRMAQDIIAGATEGDAATGASGGMWWG